MKKLLILFFISTAAVCLDKYPELNSQQIHDIFDYFNKDNAIYKQCVETEKLNTAQFRQNMFQCIHIATMLNQIKNMKSEHPAWDPKLHKPVAQLLRHTEADKNAEHAYVEGIVQHFNDKRNTAKSCTEPYDTRYAARQFAKRAHPGLSKYFESMLEPEYNDMPGRG